VDARRTPKLVLRAHLPDQRTQFHLDSRAPSPQVRFLAPNSDESRPDATHHRFRLDNRNDRQDRWKPSIYLDEEPAVVVGKLGSTPRLAPQNDQLMSEHRILRLKPALRLERRGQHGQNKPNQRDYRASLADSVTRKIRIGFSAHTAILPTRDFNGDIEQACLTAGQSAGNIGEILPAGEIIRRMTSEAKAALDRLAAKREAA